MLTVILQARMNSTRLPGKVLLPLVEGCPMLGYQIDRLRASRNVDKVLVATGLHPVNDPIEIYCLEKSVDIFRGDDNDVLSRYYHAAKTFSANTIVRVTGDCPFVDPEIIDQMVVDYKESHVDFLANTVPPETRTFPDGSDLEIFSFEGLERAFMEATSAEEREHVTFYFWKSKNNFRIKQYRAKDDFSNYRFTVDYPEDFEVAKFLAEELIKRKQFGSLQEVIKILDDNPQIKNMNRKYAFGIGWNSEQVI